MHPATARNMQPAIATNMHPATARKWPHVTVFSPPTPKRPQQIPIVAIVGAKIMFKDSAVGTIPLEAMP